MERTKAIFIRVSEDEKTIFEILAKRKGLTVSAYIRSVILDLYFVGKQNDRG